MYILNIHEVCVTLIVQCGLAADTRNILKMSMKNFNQFLRIYDVITQESTIFILTLGFLIAKKLHLNTYKLGYVYFLPLFVRAGDLSRTNVQTRLSKAHP